VCSQALLLLLLLLLLLVVCFTAVSLGAVRTAYNADSD
jgi:hypothetical protein